MLFKQLKNFTIIDTETTGLGCYSKLVEFAAIKFRDGVPIDSFDTLVNPLMLMGEDVIKIHKITNEMVQNALPIDKVSDKIYDFIEDDVLVAHNAKFDMDVLNRRLLYGIKNSFVDTLSIFRETLDLRRYKLDYIREYLGIEIDQTHRALDDVEMLYNCLKRIDKPYNINIQNISSVKGSCKPSQIKVTKSLSNKLSNCHCVITGEIPNIARFQVWQLIVNHGGLVGNSVINKTRFLIVGKDNVGYTKLNKARMKKDRGENIDIISYQEFFSLIK
ncbi:MAG: exonuclease domain-containing protein [Sphaerochaetaceae bacterium]|nr:exonuclease domain-containing protein [Sphaerochaetaceae bacterium]